jgi:Helix-turn-helix family
VTQLTPARRIWDVVEPIAANVYFAPEVHRAYQEVGFDGPSRVIRGIEFPDMLAYFTSRGACLGDHVSGHLVAASFGVFKRPMVVAAVEEGWKRTDAPSILAARQQGATASLRRILGDEPDGLAFATTVLRRMAEAGPAEGRYLHSGLLSLGYPGDPMGDFWRAADLVREHRGDSHVAAWIDADLDATEVGLLTDPWRGQPLKSWVRTRGWTDEELDAGCDRLRSRGLLDGDELTAAGRDLREGIETATDHMERRVVAAMGDDGGELFALLDGWCDQVVAAGGYPGRVIWPGS